MSILLALAYHDRAKFETFRQLGVHYLQPLNSFSGQTWLVIPLRFVFCLKLPKYLRTVWFSTQTG